MTAPSLRFFISFLPAILHFYLCFGQECTNNEETEGSCINAEQKYEHCGHQHHFCSSTRTSVYDDGGSAVSFRLLDSPNATVCSDGPRPPKYRIANWMGRRATWKRAPRVTLNVELYGCKEVYPSHSHAATEPSSCCCSPISGSVHVWQTRPDGRYPSLSTSGNGKSSSSLECRGYQEGSSSFTFETLAPGSVGLMGGLGPNGWDVPPYMGPVLHILASGFSMDNNNYAPVLVDVPLHPNPATLQPARFVGPNLHGSAWVQRPPATTRYVLSGWKALPDENRIEMTLRLYLAATTTNEDTMSTTNLLCPSWIYGLPGSFYTEPMALCAPALLQFLSL